MKRINNIKNLAKLLHDENPNWQQIIFERLGVWVAPCGDEQHQWDLISACGFSDLDEDTVFVRAHGEDKTEYCDVNSIDDLYSYINHMDTYQSVIKNINFGLFTKAELFWVIQFRIMRVNLYDNNMEKQIYGLRAIRGEAESIWFDTSACGIDEITGIVVYINEQSTLQYAVDSFILQLEEFREYQGDWVEEAFHFLIYEPSINYTIPQSIDELIAYIKTVQY